MFWERFIQLCAENNTKPNPVASKLGISSGAVTKWKKNKITPNEVTLQKLANYFDVSVDYLVGRTDSPHPTNITNDINKQNNAKTVSIQTALSTEEKELIESFRSFPAEYKAKMINFIHDTKTEIEKDRKLDMLIEQNRKLIHARAAAYGGETADVILTPEEDAKIDELLQKERERKAKNGDDIL